MRGSQDLKHQETMESGDFYVENSNIEILLSQYEAEEEEEDIHLKSGRTIRTKSCPKMAGVRRAVYM